MENNVQTTVIQKSKRDARYELVRVLSIMLVLLVHVNATYVNQESFFANGSLVRESFSSTFLLCNGLFFILSGKFALTFDENRHSYRDYYFKKVIYLLLPMFLYMAIETIAYAIYTQNTSDLGKTFFYNITDRFTHRHYWFMFTIVFDLMLAPIFAKAFREMSDKVMVIFFAIGLIHLTLFSFGPLISGWFAYESPFGNFHFYFFLGGVIDRVIKYFGKKRLIVIGLICFAFARIQVIKLGYSQFINDFSPFYLFEVIALWIIICEVYNVTGQKGDKVIIFLGKYSFPVYLIHYMLLEFLAKDNWKTIFTDYPLYVFVTFIVLFIISLIASIIIDKLFLQFVQKGLQNVYSKLTKKS